MIYLASSGDEVKLWDAGNFTLRDQFSPYGNAAISDVCWSQDGRHLAMCCKTDNVVHMRKVQMSQSTQSIPSDSFSVLDGVSCIDFSSDSSSRYVLCGSTNGTAAIWDRKSSKMKKTFSVTKNPLTRVRWNWNDSHIAMSSDKGEIMLCNVVNGVASSPFSTPNTESISQLTYNPYSKSCLVSVSEGGVVSAWDTNAHRLQFAFKSSHQAPASDLAFSPINNHLMVSVGLDKRCVFYDLHNRKPVNTILSDHPLTSCDIHHDGVTLLLGSSRGKLFIYDLRQDSTPIHNISAHSSAVRNLTFVKREEGRDDSASSSSSLTNMQLKRQLPVTPSLVEAVYNNDSNNVNIASPRPDALRSRTDVLSPLRDANNSSVLEGTDRSWNLSMSHNYITNNNSHVAQASGAISPLRDGDSMLSSREQSSIHGRNTSLFSQMYLNSADNSHADQHSLPNNVSARSPRSPPKVSSLYQSGLGASPSLNHLNGSAETPGQAASASGQTVMKGHNSPPHYMPNRYTDVDTPAQRTPGTPLVQDQKPSPATSRISNGIQHTDSSPSSSLSSAGGQSSNMRHWVRDLLKEQLQEHQTTLKQEIRSMIANVGQLPASNTCEPVGAPRTEPNTFQAEFLRSLVKEEVEELWHDRINPAFWDMHMLLLKQVFLLEKRLEAGFAECAINPLLLDEIDRLREENERLKKIF